MRLVRVRPAEWLAGAAGVLLIVSLFLDWSGGDTAWGAFAVVAVLLALLSLFGIALLVAQAARPSPALPTALSIGTVLAGFVATILVAIELLAGSDLGAGAWLGLAGALGLLAGGWWSMATETVRGMPAPDVEVRPAP